MIFSKNGYIIKNHKGTFYVKDSTGKTVFRSKDFGLAVAYANENG